jgi:NlpC/P60 family putative phage cell wall peptidase
MALTRTDVVEEARSWLGTPYRHQASEKGVGCDCLGLVRGVWRALYGAEPQRSPPYTPDWAEAHGDEALLSAARRWLVPVSDSDMAAGDVLLFRMRKDSPLKHAAILVSPTRSAHAYWGRAVVESRLSPFWRARFGAAFRFPGVL